MARMHDEEIDVDAGVVAAMLARQFPRWADLPLRRVRSAGTDNAMFRLGDELSVRLPRVPWAVATLRKEYAWLPRFASLLPVPVPTPVAIGEPADGYPWPWTVCRWVAGVNPEAGSPEVGAAFASDLAAFVAAFHSLDPDGAPPTVWHRPLHEEGERFVAAFARVGPVLTGLGLDVDALTSVWRSASTAPRCGAAVTWIHGDIGPGNVVVGEGRLVGVLDFSAMGLGDPASDLRPSWNLLGPDTRAVLRERLGVDEPTWARGRGWVLLQAVVQIDYLGDRNPALTDNAAYALRQLCVEVAAGTT